MKAERRHELKHNELADWLGTTAERMKPQATAVLAGLGLLAAIVIGSMWYFSGETASASRAWSRYFYAFNDRQPQEVLQDLVKNQSGSKAAWWALAAVADMNLAEGVGLLYSDRADATKRLEAAKEAYLKVEGSPDPMLRTRARLGLGKVYESLCQPKEAAEYYDKVATSEKDSAIGKAAAADAKRMKDPREVEFLAWFAEQKPKRPAPFPGVGGPMPGMPSELSDRPDFGMPKLGVDQFGIGKGETSAAFPAPGTTPVANPTEPGATDPTKPEGATPDAAKPGDNAPTPVTPNTESPKSYESEGTAKKQSE